MTCSVSVANAESSILLISMSKQIKHWMSTKYIKRNATLKQMKNMNFKLNMKEINKILGTFKLEYKTKMILRNYTFLKKHDSLKLLKVSLSCLLFCLMFSEGEIISLYFLQVWWALQSINKHCKCNAKTKANHTAQ